MKIFKNLTPHHILLTAEMFIKENKIFKSYIFRYPQSTYVILITVTKKHLKKFK